MKLGDIAEVFSGKLLSRYLPTDKQKDEHKNKLCIKECSAGDPGSFYLLNYGSDLSREGIKYRDDMWGCFDEEEKNAKELKKNDLIRTSASFLAEENDIIIKITLKNSLPYCAAYIDKETAKKGIFVSSAFLIVKCSEIRFIDKLVETYRQDAVLKEIIPEKIRFPELSEQCKTALAKYLYVYLNLMTAGTNSTGSEGGYGKITPGDLRSQDIPFRFPPLKLNNSESLILEIKYALMSAIAKMEKTYEIFAKSNEIINTLEKMKEAELQRVSKILLEDDDREKTQTEENDNGEE